MSSVPRHAPNLIALNIALDGDGVVRGADGLPVAFRLFKRGENETSKGVFLFDDEAARSVMADAASRGIDYAIDLEHLSLDQDSPSYDPDARGWFSLEIRGGELWAANVRWTPDGARRLTEKTQRFISPTFPRTPDNRVTEILNIALVATPATHGTPALVAATRRTHMKTRKDLQNELAARVALAKSRVKLAEGDPASEAPAGKFAAVRAAADKASQALADLESNSGDVDAAMGALDAALAAVAAFEDAASAMGASKSEETPEPAPEAMAEDPAKVEDPQKMSAIARDLVRLRAENAAYRAKQAKAEEDAAVVALAAEMNERDESAAKLVGRVLTPAMLAELTADAPIARVRRAVELSAGAPQAVALGRIAPVHGSTGDGSKEFVTPYGVVTLTANQLRECERSGAKPEAFAALQANRLSASKG